MTENRKTASFKHGHARSNNGGPTPTYMSWASMIGRCYRRYHSKFPRYGAKGITVAKRWHVFENFLADMDERPPGKTLDRWPDPAGNYKPGNCRWATPKEQRDNWR